MGPAERHARAVVAARSGGVCETCGRRWAVDWHHRLPAAHGGPWTAANGLHLCRACHHTITTRPAWAYTRGWLVHRGQDPARVATRYLTEHGELDVLLTEDGGLAWAAEPVAPAPPHKPWLATA